MRVISIVSGKGGVGKTTVVANLGTILASKFNKKVILVDCNITTPHLGLYMGIHQHSITLNHLMRNESEVSEAVYVHPSGAKIVPASLSLNDLDGIDMMHLKSVVNSIKVTYPDTDFIILDCAPGFGREAMAGMRSGDEVLYVTTPYFPIVIDIVKCVHVAEELNLENIGLLINMKKNNKHELTDAEIGNITELPVVGSIALHHDVLNSLHKKIPVCVTKPNSKVSKQFIKLASLITGESSPKVTFLDTVFGLFD
ncbi:MAG: P-loop NTPase [DPANN group archaeon]|nr:P-loop NTPase [DPANN group archaeon]